MKTTNWNKDTTGQWIFLPNAMTMGEIQSAYERGAPLEKTCYHRWDVVNEIKITESKWSGTSTWIDRYILRCRDCGDLKTVKA